MRCIPYRRAAFRHADLSKYLPNDTAAVILAVGGGGRGVQSGGVLLFGLFAWKRSLHLLLHLLLLHHHHHQRNLWLMILFLILGTRNFSVIRILGFMSVFFVDASTHTHTHVHRRVHVEVFAKTTLRRFTRN